MTYSEFDDLASSFPQVIAIVHFKRIGYKVKGKKMICTYDDQTETINIFLTPSQQLEYCDLDDRHIYPVPNKWGEKGATTFEINYLDYTLISSALEAAYQNVTANK